MVRLISFVLFTACFLTQANGLMQAQATSEQAPAASQQPPDAAAAPSSATRPGFPFDEFKEFSAVMEGSILVGDDREGHIYRSGDRLRMQGAEGMGYFIADLDKFESYGLSPMGCMKDSHMYFRAFPFSAQRPGRKIERTEAGTETLDGHVCKIENVTVTGKDLPKVMKMKFWEAQDLQGFPIKVEVLTGQTHATIQYKNVVIGPQDSSLFIRPRTCSGSLPQPTTKKPAASPATGTPKAKVPAAPSPK